MRAADAGARSSLADSQRRRHTRSPGGLSATARSVAGGASEAARSPSASATPQPAATRVKTLWEDPSAPSRSRSSAKSSASQRRVGKRGAGEKRPGRSSKQAAGSPSKTTALPEAARALVQRVVEWDARLKTGAPDLAALNPLADLDASVVSLQSAFRAACVDLLASYPEAAKKMDLDRRLWENWYRRLEQVQRLDGLVARERLGECNHFYQDLVTKLEATSKNVNLSAEAREAVQLSLQHSLVALGDIERYKQQLVGTFGSASAWSSAMEFYQRARAIAPGSGKVYNQLALIAARNKKFLEAAYLYARSLGCQHPFPSRENLVQSLKKGALVSTSASLFARPGDHRVEVRASKIMDKLYALLVRSVGLRSWREDLASVQTAMRSLLNIEDLLNSAEYRDQVADAIVQIVSVNLLLIYDIQSGNNAAVVPQAKLDLDTRGRSAMCALDLLYSLGTSMLQQFSDFLQATSDYRQLQNVGNALLPGVNALLLWLHSHDWLTQARSNAAEPFNASCTKLHFVLPSSPFAMYFVGFAAAGDRELPEELEAKGFLPLDFAQKRFSTAFSSAPARSLSSTYAKGRSARDRENSPSSISQKQFEVRMARMIRLCGQLALMRDRDTGEKLDMPSQKKPVSIDRLCSQCFNSSTFDDGACEFCGFEDDMFEAFPDSEDDANDEIVLNAQYLGGMTLANETARGWHGTVNGSSNPQALGYYSNEVTGKSQPPSPPKPSSFAAVMAIGSQYSEFQNGFQPAPSRSKCLIVIDAPNVAMRHGMNQQFSSLGVRLAVDYFRTLGHRVVAFIPDYMLKNEQEQLAARRNQPRSANVTLDDSNSTVSKIPDDIDMLRAMTQEGVLVPTPPQDYDDSYCIQYAGLHNGCVVTNDLFRDHVQNMEGPRERKEAMRAWLKAHQISFTWVQNEFLPNPNFRFPA